jgi:hypothetical protein
VKNVANVEANGINPSADNPIVIPTIFCSAINDWKDLSGNLSKKYLVMVEFLTSPSTATIDLFFCPIFNSAFPNASLVAISSPNLYLFNIVLFIVGFILF